MSECKPVNPTAGDLAGRIAEAMFSGDGGEKAHLLVLMTADGRQVGAWCRRKVARLLALLIDRVTRPRTPAGAPSETAA